MRRFLGGLLIVLGPVMFLPALFMESDLGNAVALGGLASFIVGLALMARRPSAEEVAEGMVRKDVAGSAIVLGAPVVLVAIAALLWRFLA